MHGRRTVDEESKEEYNKPFNKSVTQGNDVTATVVQLLCRLLLSQAALRLKVSLLCYDSNKLENYSTFALFWGERVFIVVVKYLSCIGLLSSKKMSYNNLFFFF